MISAPAYAEEETRFTESALCTHNDHELEMNQFLSPAVSSLLVQFLEVFGVYSVPLQWALSHCIIANCINLCLLTRPDWSGPCQCYCILCDIYRGWCFVPVSVLHAHDCHSCSSSAWKSHFFRMLFNSPLWSSIWFCTRILSEWQSCCIVRSSSGTAKHPISRFMYTSNSTVLALPG